MQIQVASRSHHLRAMSSASALGVMMTMPGSCRPGTLFSTGLTVEKPHQVAVHLVRWQMVSSVGVGLQKDMDASGGGAAEDPGAEASFTALHDSFGWACATFCHEEANRGSLEASSSHTRLLVENQLEAS
jgi:hypothetical protein